MIYIVEEDEMFFRKNTNRKDIDLALNHFMKMNKEESDNSLEEESPE